MAGSWDQQFSSGDQGYNRVKFWRDDYRVCPICQKTDIAEDKTCCGCRHNGDGYGTSEFTCSACNWSTSFQYDESDTPYFYETRNFHQKEKDIDKAYAEYLAEKNKPKPPTVLGAYIKTRYLELRLLTSDDTMYKIMQKDGYDITTISTLLKENPTKIKKTVIPKVLPFKLRVSPDGGKWVLQKLNSVSLEDDSEDVAQEPQPPTTPLTVKTKGSISKEVNRWFGYVSDKVAAAPAVSNNGDGDGSSDEACDRHNYDNHLPQSNVCIMS